MPGLFILHTNLGLFLLPFSSTNASIPHILGDSQLIPNFQLFGMGSAKDAWCKYIVIWEVTPIMKCTFSLMLRRHSSVYIVNSPDGQRDIPVWGRLSYAVTPNKWMTVPCHCWANFRDVWRRSWPMECALIGNQHLLDGRALTPSYFGEVTWHFTNGGIACPLSEEVTQVGTICCCTNQNVVVSDSSEYDKRDTAHLWDHFDIDEICSTLLASKRPDSFWFEMSHKANFEVPKCIMEWFSFLCSFGMWDNDLPWFII